MVTGEWKPRKSSSPPVEGKLFPLTFPFIDQALAQACAICTPENRVNECFYEKVIKVKTDVAAVLNIFRTNQVQETLVDAIHRFRASIRTLSGPLLGPVQVGVRSKAQVRHDRDEPGIVGCCHLSRGLKNQHSLRSHPNKASGCRCCKPFR